LLGKRNRNAKHARGIDEKTGPRKHAVQVQDRRREPLLNIDDDQRALVSDCTF
jgi:hypothetical protein